MNSNVSAHIAEAFMCCRSQQNVNLDESELTAAMKLLDKRGSGYIEFDEFVDWWVNKVRHSVCITLKCRARLICQHIRCWRGYMLQLYHAYCCRASMFCFVLTCCMFAALSQSYVRYPEHKTGALHKKHSQNALHNIQVEPKNQEIKV